MYSEIPTRTHPVRALWSMGEGGRSREGRREREYNMLRARVMWDMATDLTHSPSMFFAIRVKKFLDGFRASSHLTPHGLSLMETCVL